MIRTWNTLIQRYEGTNDDHHCLIQIADMICVICGKDWSKNAPETAQERAGGELAQKRADTADTPRNGPYEPSGAYGWPSYKEASFAVDPAKEHAEKLAHIPVLRLVTHETTYGTGEIDDAEPMLHQFSDTPPAPKKKRTTRKKLKRQRRLLRNLVEDLSKKNADLYAERDEARAIARRNRAYLEHEWEKQP